MNKRKITGGILAAVTALSFCTAPYALAFDAPSDIELHIGDTELSTDEVSGGMIVNVPLYLDNNPGFIALGFIVKLDSRLQFEDMNAVASSAEGFGDISVGTKADWGNIIEINGFAHNIFKFEGNGQIAELHIVIPEGTQAGTYPIELLAQYDDRETSIITENSASAYFGPESFSVLEAGNITISEPYSPPPPPPETQPQNSNEPAKEPQQNNEPETQAQTKQTTAAATAVSTNKTTTVSDTTKKASETLTSSSSVVTTTETTASTAEETTSTALTSKAEKVNKKEKSAGKMLIPIIAATVAVIAAAVGIIVKKKGVNK